jgi:hypothetical protein
MKLLLLTTGVLLCPGFTAFAQIKEITTTQPNGVVVHNATGVASTTPITEDVTRQPRTLADWNLAECIDAIPRIEDKIYLLGDSEQELKRKEDYRIFIDAIHARIKVLTQNTSK